MSLICAYCGIEVDDGAYYGACKLVPFCSQQHARQRNHQCDGTCQDRVVDLFDHLADEANMDRHGRACRGSIKDMAYLLKFVDVKKFLLELFPLPSHAQVHPLLSKDMYAADAICHFFDSKYM